MRWNPPPPSDYFPVFPLLSLPRSMILSGKITPLSPPPPSLHPFFTGRFLLFAHPQAHRFLLSENFFRTFSRRPLPLAKTLSPAQWRWLRRIQIPPFFCQFSFMLPISSSPFCGFLLSPPFFRCLGYKQFFFKFQIVTETFSRPPILYMTVAFPHLCFLSKVFR